MVFYLFSTLFFEDIQKKLISFNKNIDIYFLDNKEILEENIKLKKEIQDSKLKNIFSNYYYNKTKILEKRISSMKNNFKERKIFNNFIDNKLPFQSNFILDNKNNINVKKGDVVYVFDNIALGIVLENKNKLIKVKRFFDYGVKENYIIMNNGKIIFEGVGTGESLGMIKLKLPRDLEIPKESIIILDDNVSIVGIFLRDDFKSQNTEREVYFRTILNPWEIFQVEI